ncbi:MAG: helix-turn-helix domain-containing protein [Pseudomonadota bacterium]
MSQPPDLSQGLERCSTCPIRHRAVCSYSSPAELTRLDDVKFYRDFEAGQEIVGEGEPTPFVGSVVSGVVALHKTLEDGRRQMVGLLFASDFIGRPMRNTAPFDAIAVSPVRMCLFHRREFETIMTDSRSLERRLLEMTLDELEAAREWMLLLGRKTARERLASFLMILVRRQAMLDKGSMANGSLITLPLTREAIAEYLGLTIETVSRQFTRMRKNGTIDLPDRRTIRILDLAELSGIAGEIVEDFNTRGTA